MTLGAWELVWTERRNDDRRGSGTLRPRRSCSPSGDRGQCHCCGDQGSEPGRYGRGPRRICKSAGSAMLCRDPVGNRKTFGTAVSFPRRIGNGDVGLQRFASAEPGRCGLAICCADSQIRLNELYAAVLEGTHASTENVLASSATKADADRVRNCDFKAA